MKNISIIVPCFNEEDVIEHAYKRLVANINKIEKYKFKIIFVNDGSKDSTKKIVSNLIKNTSHKLINLSRNFGHQIAVSAGIDATSDSDSALIIIDADLQDPPELFPSMINMWESGFQVVYARRKTRLGESFFKKITAKYFYKTLNMLTDIEIPHDTGDFRLIDKVVIKSLKSMPEKHRFLRGMIAWVGYKQVSIDFIRNERYAGITKYPLSKMISFAIDGILSFSNTPLRIATFLSLFLIVFSIFFILYILYVRLFTDTWVYGWTALMFVITLFGAIQMLIIGILGEYVGRIYDEIKKRPLYFIDEN